MSQSNDELVCSRLTEQVPHVEVSSFEGWVVLASGGDWRAACFVARSLLEVFAYPFAWLSSGLADRGPVMGGAGRLFANFENGGLRGWRSMPVASVRSRWVARGQVRLAGVVSRRFLVRPVLPMRSRIPPHEAQRGEVTRVHSQFFHPPVIWPHWRQTPRDGVPFLRCLGFFGSFDLSGRFIATPRVKNR